MTVRNLFHHRPRAAFVFSGGGNLGAIQIGQVKALVERGITPDAVIGCSVGALNGAALAGTPGPEAVGLLETVWRSLRREDIFPPTKVGRGPWIYVKNGMSAYADTGLRKLVERCLHFSRFEQATTPFHVVATSLATGTERWFNTGDVALPLLASTALPGAFPPVDIGGELFIDGGVVNNIPISKAFELRAKRVYVLDVGNMERERRTPKRPYEVLMQAVSIARAYRYRIERDNIPEGVEMIRMPAIDVGKLRYDDFSRTGELIDRSYAACAAFLDSHHITDAQTA